MTSSLAVSKKAWSLTFKDVVWVEFIVIAGVVMISCSPENIGAYIYYYLLHLWLNNLAFGIWCTGSLDVARLLLLLIYV